MKRMTIQEYATLRGITKQAVGKQIKNNRALPGVKKHEKYGRTFVLIVDESKIPGKPAK